MSLLKKKSAAQAPTIAVEDVLFYKYYSDLDEKMFDEYDVDLNNQFTKERANLLGVSVPNLNPWATNYQEKSKQCLIKLYDDNTRCFKLNENVTFIGILEFRNQSGEDAQMQDADQFEGRIPNEQNIPHLHAITYRRNQILNNNPALKASSVAADTLVKETHFYQDTKAKLLAVLKLILGGDSFASEYIIMNLISRIHNRQNELLLGKLNINLTNLQTLEAKYLSKFIGSITPLTNYIQMSIESLENCKLTPSKNYQTNILEGSLLQMLDGTVVIVDETNMGVGQIKENGILNIKTMATLIEQ